MALTAAMGLSREFVKLLFGYLTRPAQEVDNLIWGVIKAQSKAESLESGFKINLVLILIRLSLS